MHIKVLILIIFHAREILQLIQFMLIQLKGNKFRGRGIMSAIVNRTFLAANVLGQFREIVNEIKYSNRNSRPGIVCN